ncbi:hypothetical protein T310_7694, partial [Rasamsonia emersonii CBS 393.64]
NRHRNRLPPKLRLLALVEIRHLDETRKRTRQKGKGREERKVNRYMPLLYESQRQKKRPCQGARKSQIRMAVKEARPWPSVQREDRPNWRARFFSLSLSTCRTANGKCRTLNLDPDQPLFPAELINIEK